MTEINEIELGEQVAAVCGKAVTDADLIKRLSADILSTLRAEGIDVPLQMEERVVGFVSAMLFGLEKNARAAE